MAVHPSYSIFPPCEVTLAWDGQVYQCQKDAGTNPLDLVPRPRIAEPETKDPCGSKVYSRQYLANGKFLTAYDRQMRQYADQKVDVP